MPDTDPLDEGSELQAIRWAELIADRDLTDAEHQEFSTWIANPAHEDAFVPHLDLIFELRTNLSRKIKRELREKAGRESAARHAFIDLTATVWRWAAAAVLIGALAVLGVWFSANLKRAPTNESYMTGTGETKDIALADGSVAHLDSETVIRWIGGPCDRRVALLQGQVFFEIRHDPRCPFRVTLDRSEVEVLGTRFNSYRRPNGEVVVTVIEGHVRVRHHVQNGDIAAWQEDLSANQQLSYEPTGLAQRTRIVDAASVTKWRDHEISYVEERLDRVVADLQRYSTQKIVIADPRLLAIHVTGELNTRDVRLTLSRLARMTNLKVDEQGTLLVLTYGDPSSARSSDPKP